MLYQLECVNEDFCVEPIFKPTIDSAGLDFNLKYLMVLAYLCI